MDCRTFREKWLEHRTGELAGEEAEALEAHLRACDACARFAAQANGVWNSLDASATVQTPRTLRASTLDRVRDLLQEERSSLAPALSLRQLLATLIAGAALASLGLWSLSRQMNLRAIPLAAVSACTIWLSGLFILSSSLIVGHYRYGRLKLDTISSIGIAGAGLLFAGTYFCPQLELIEYWLGSNPGRFFTDQLGEGMSHVVFGFFYAMIPTLVVSITFGRQISSDRMRHGILAALMFLFLLLPSVYIQCFYLPLSIAALTALGVILGGFGGTLGGLGIHRFRYGFA